MHVYRARCTHHRSSCTTMKSIPVPEAFCASSLSVLYARPIGNGAATAAVSAPISHPIHLVCLLGRAPSRSNRTQSDGRTRIEKRAAFYFTLFHFSPPDRCSFTLFDRLRRCCGCCLTSAPMFTHFLLENIFFFCIVHFLSFCT